MTLHLYRLKDPFWPAFLEEEHVWASANAVRNTKYSCYLARNLPHSPAAALRQVVAASFTSFDFNSLYQVRPSVFEGEHVVVCVAPNHSGIVGLLSGSRRRIGPVDLLYAHTNFIDERFQRTGMLLSLWKVFTQAFIDEEGGFPPLLVSKTFNPMVYSTLLTAARLGAADLYPQIDQPTNPEMVALARRVANEILPGVAFEEHTGVLRGAWPKNAYFGLPKTRRDHVYRYFERHLSPGDGLLCALRLNESSNFAALVRPLGIRVEAN